MGNENATVEVVEMPTRGRRKGQNDEALQAIIKDAAKSIEARIKNAKIKPGQAVKVSDILAEAVKARKHGKKAVKVSTMATNINKATRSKGIRVAEAGKDYVAGKVKVAAKA